VKLFFVFWNIIINLNFENGENYGVKMERIKSLDDYLGSVRPKQNEIEERGAFSAYLNQMRIYAVGLAFDSEAEDYKPYLELFRGIGLKESLDKVIELINRDKTKLSEEMMSEERKIEFLRQKVKEIEPYGDLAILLLSEFDVKEAIPEIKRYMKKTENGNWWWGVYVLKKLGCSKEEIRRVFRKSKNKFERLGKRAGENEFWKLFDEGP
jgi:hypothetical protein